MITALTVQLDSYLSILFRSSAIRCVLDNIHIIEKVLRCVLPKCYRAHETLIKFLQKLLLMNFKSKKAKKIIQKNVSVLFMLSQ